ncbi:GNAT family N-acetyltransferase [Cryptosporangium phraense]|uniref:GNAT family N-acetyltransferase n=1 Tax=Cryptosporangium phraense TaxID=2593070 RepID=A0A545AKG7_9ACTN|nr:GNAT family N-acetyltransferase [Cryptosporangium phraense]TQS41822.1 GNAT family N-acetyltransferase [Cryptosporangium phraense]
MAGSEFAIDVHRHDASAVPTLIDQLCDVYADAYGVEPGEKVDGFRRRMERASTDPGFELFTVEANGALVGFAFGYPLRPDTKWWDGLVPEPVVGFADEDGTRTVVLSEIEIRRAVQQQGIGRRLHDAFLAARPEPRATLATGADSPSQEVYPRWGWTRAGTVPGGPNDYFAGYVLFVKER